MRTAALAARRLALPAFGQLPLRRRLPSGIGRSARSAAEHPGLLSMMRGTIEHAHLAGRGMGRAACRGGMGQGARWHRLRGYRMKLRGRGWCRLELRRWKVPRAWAAIVARRMASAVLAAGVEAVARLLIHGERPIAMQAHAMVAKAAAAGKHEAGGQTQVCRKAHHAIPAAKRATKRTCTQTWERIGRRSAGKLGITGKATPNCPTSKTSLDWRDKR